MDGRQPKDAPHIGIWDAGGDRSADATDASPKTPGGPDLSAGFADLLCQPVPGIVSLMRDGARPPLLSRADLTEARFAQQFADAYAGTLRYDHRQRRWMVYDQPLWIPDTTGDVMRRQIAFARQQQIATVANLPDPLTRKEALAFMFRMEHRRGLEDIEVLARNLEPLTCAGDGWDRHPHLLGTRQGILNLRCLAAPPLQDAALLITKGIGCAYDPDARCGRWLTFLDEVFVGRTGVIDWFQKALGYSLTGLTTEQVLFVLFGRGANGKSVLLETIAYMLGDYAANVPFSLFEANARSTISNDVALLVGRRFVTASETTDTIRLNEARIKALTGQDTTTARQMYRDFFSFQPMAKFWLSTNHLPAVRDRSHGFWRRIRIVPFDAQFDGQKRDNGLGDKLRAEASGILLWALDGCARWFREGLGEPPSCVGEATSQFEHESDRLGDFLDDRCVLRPAASVGASELWESYRAWADQQQLGPSARLSQPDFRTQVKARFDGARTNRGQKYRGVGLQSAET